MRIADRDGGHVVTYRLGLGRTLALDGLLSSGFVAGMIRQR